MSNYKVGDLAIKYETGGKGPGFISNGASWGDPGGDSYGSYQLETKLGTMQDYLKGNDKFINVLKKLKVNSPEFRSTWKKLAVDDPAGFQQSQFDFLAKKPNGHNSAMVYAKGLGWSIDSFALESAIFSTSNQSGGWKKIFNMAGIKLGETVATQINKLYDARAKYFRGLNLSAAIKKSIIQARTIQERADCLKLL